MTAQFVERFYPDEIVTQARTLESVALRDMVYAPRSVAARKRLDSVELPEELTAEAMELIGNRFRGLFRDREQQAYRAGMRTLGALAIERGQVATAELVADDLQRDRHMLARLTGRAMARRIAHQKRPNAGQ